MVLFLLRPTRITELGPSPKKALKPLSSLKTIENKDITNPK